MRVLTKKPFRLIPTRAVLLAALGLTINCGGAAAQEADARLWLEDVMSLREQIPPSHLHLKANFQSSFTSTSVEYSIVFDGSKRSFSTTNVSPASRMVFNGIDVISYDGSGSATVRDPDTQTADYFFDPRLLGITAAYAWDASIADVLGLTNGKILPLKDEQIGEVSCKLVQFELEGPVLVSVWIVPTTFQVLKYEEHSKGRGRRLMESTYESTTYPWLPSRIEGKEFDAAGQLLFSREITILAADTIPRPSTNSWELAGALDGFELPTWVPVTDVRSHVVIGYWRDGILGPPEPWEPQPTGKKFGAIRFGLAIAILAIMLTPLLLVRRHQRDRA